ncbi:DnaB-like helicase C-terminal domain-containing protein [Waddlia chondrophila]|uniref:Putative replicative DNA helicase n=1 Tax=Waddlia chondrophila (strain ATCC VR-1470 / WSU 86-1044) TaxID=716544 RepID=D6YV76_WADCW|nr:DnaB-like helicase C-terminal domain-containing protein [Waddlia chondrophila]ADI38037.1 putative replicative DNA helicase [Waddlia chondrophila WSU 86-1044]
MTISLSDLLTKEPPFYKRVIKRKNHYAEHNSDIPSRYNAIPTGFSDIDQLCGLVEHGVNVIASVPAMGKTALSINIALNIASLKKSGLLKDINKIKYFNFESTKEQFILRLLSNKSDIESDKIIKGILDKDEIIEIENAVEDLQALDFEVLQELPRNEEDVLEYLDQTCNEGDVIFLDYLNLIVNNIRSEPYTSGVDFIRHLKLLAINRKVTFVILSQLNKKVDERPGHRPMMQDLPYGVLSNHADLIMFLLRREYYDPMDKPGMAEIIIGKNRNGCLGCVNLVFRKEISQFCNYIPINTFE